MYVCRTKIEPDDKTRSAFFANYQTGAAPRRKTLVSSYVAMSITQLTYTNPSANNKMAYTVLVSPLHDSGMYKPSALTIAIIINAIVGNLSSVHPHVALQVRVIGLNPRVNDAHSNVIAPCSLS